MNRSIRTTYRYGLALVAGFVFVTAGCGFFSVTPVNTPVQQGQVQVHVEFDNLDTAEWNALTEFVKELATKHSKPFGGTDEVLLGDSSSSHNSGNDGLIDQNYTPDHAIPSPETQDTMRALLKAYLEENNIDPQDVTLELRYAEDADFVEQAE